MSESGSGSGPGHISGSGSGSGLMSGFISGSGPGSGSGSGIDGKQYMIINKNSILSSFLITFHAIILTWVIICMW